MCVGGGEGGPIWSTLLSLVLTYFPAMAGWSAGLALSSYFSYMPLPPPPSCFCLFFLGLQKRVQHGRVHEGKVERTSQVLGYNRGALERSRGLGSHRWLGSWLSYVGLGMAGISLSGPWESGLQAAHSSRLQLLFCCHLTPLGPSPASLLLLQPWSRARWASPTRNFSWGE